MEKVPVIRQRNSLNTIRLIGAIQVFYVHALLHLELSGPEIFNKLFSVFSGVPIFFILSGFLVWESIAKSANVKEYALKRIFRIYPELWGGVACNAVIMIIVYWNNISWIPFALFLITQSTFFQFWTPESLRGYGVGAPNGSLWTICVMLQCYVALFFLRKKLHGEKLCTWMMIFSIAIAVSLSTDFIKELVPEIVGKLYVQTFLPYMWLFIIGAFLAEYFQKIYTTVIKYWWLFLILTWILRFIDFDFGYYGVIRSTLMSFVIIGFAYRFPNVNIPVDISYGIYIYHMVVINLMVELGYAGDYYYLFIAFGMSALLGMVSYYSIGTISRRLKRNIEMQS